LKEQLAELAHEQWSGWMVYLFSKGDLQEDGTWVMPKWAVDRWKLQANTQYLDLSDEEMDSDRKEANKFLEVFRTHLDTLKQREVSAWLREHGV